jgi:hypothetical protein
MQFALLACGILSFLVVLFFLPETSHPQTRGIDKAMMIEESSSGGEGGRGRSGRKWVWVNPLASLWLLRSPNLLAVVSAFNAACVGCWWLIYFMGGRAWQGC